MLIAWLKALSVGGFIVDFGARREERVVGSKVGGISFVVMISRFNSDNSHPKYPGQMVELLKLHG